MISMLTLQSLECHHLALDKIIHASISYASNLLSETKIISLNHVRWQKTGIHLFPEATAPMSVLGTYENGLWVNVLSSVGR